MKAIFISLIFLVGCSRQKDSKVQISKQNKDDSIQLLADKVADSVVRSMEIENDYKGSFKDNKLTKESPIEILSAEFVKRSYSNYKDVRIKYKNVSDTDPTPIILKKL